MGVYDYQIGQQVADLGNPITPVEVDVINHGGEVLVIEALPTWDRGGYDDVYPQLDQDQEVVYVPLLINAIAPETVILSGYDYKTRTREGRTLIRDMVLEHGDIVMAVPSYIGVISEKETYLLHPGHDWRTEQPGVWRYWAGIPITDANRDAAKVILNVGVDRVRKSDWETLVWIASMSETGEGPEAFDIWAYVCKPELLNDFGMDCVAQHIEWDGEEDALQTALGYQEMIDRGYVWDGSETQEDTAPLHFDPMSTVLQNHPEALRLWDLMLSRNQQYRGRYLNASEHPGFTEQQESYL